MVVSEENLPAYTRAKKKLEGYLLFENQLVRSDTVGISAALFQSLPQRLTSLVPKQLACFFFYVCVCFWFVCFVLQVMKSWAGVWEHGQWNPVQTLVPKPSHCPVLDHLPGNEAEYNTLRLTRYALAQYSGGKI